MTIRQDTEYNSWKYTSKNYATDSDTHVQTPKQSGPTEMGSKLGGADSIIRGQDWLTELYLKNGETTLTG